MKLTKQQFEALEAMVLAYEAREQSEQDFITKKSEACRICRNLRPFLMHGRVWRLDDHHRSLQVLADAIEVL